MIPTRPHERSGERSNAGMRSARATVLSGIAAAVLAWYAPPATAGPAPCRSAVDKGVLPVWARGGFSSPRPRIPHVVGAGSRIAAILFGYPLLSPPGLDRNNKILWVSRLSLGRGTALWIHAQRMEGARLAGPPVTRVVHGGPGPSIIDLPAPGCWRLTLHWSGRADTLDLLYATG